ncbi:hypothetical protein OPKNFCMD_6912 [Methylobacterium crusticola]|uniref:Uncharacterized protein n=1 Tax=Methylobacterium crusticola TaxID=1697972 RepID=A0ABQ4RBN8_9HYPH|nr:hypothetical protein OPKNFCMD_6912 [Methylobacterium crusticola]
MIKQGCIIGQGIECFLFIDIVVCLIGKNFETMLVSLYLNAHLASWIERIIL